jgi:hypothetical protein
MTTLVLQNGKSLLLTAAAVPITAQYGGRSATLVGDHGKSLLLTAAAVPITAQYGGFWFK